MGDFQGEPAKFKVTSTAGHIYNLDFSNEYNDWNKHEPEELFDAPLQNLYDSRARLPEHLAAEAADCDALVLWLDCDREGENICFEVIRIAVSEMRQSRVFDGAFRDRVFRAKFSSLVPADLQHAMGSLGSPNLNESLSVDARREIDLRLGVVFSRFQTQYFRKNFAAQLGNLARTVTYGPCQMPTLWFCVHRHCVIKAFVPRPYWELSVEIKLEHALSDGTQHFTAHSARGSIWDKGEADRMLEGVSGASEVRMAAPRVWTTPWERPLPLNTVAMLRKASERLCLSPGDTMHLAEQLYLKGILSYPRTETSCYPPAFDVAATAKLLQGSVQFSGLAGRVLDAQVKPRTDGVDCGDHPPITPVKPATQEQCKDEWSWELYKMVCEHFFATISPDCVIREAEVCISVRDIEFVAASSRVASEGFTWCNVTGDHADESAWDLTGVASAAAGSAQGAKLMRHATRPPPHLSESALLELMERHAIGTDASMAQHVGNIVKRGYVVLDASTRELMPEPLGLALTFAYTLVDPGLAQPTVRASIENECNLIAQGRARKHDVVNRVMSIFRKKFRGFCLQVDRVPVMLATAYALQMRRAGEGEALRQWNQAAALLATTKPEELLHRRESVVLADCPSAEGDAADSSAAAAAEEERRLAAIAKVRALLDELGFQAGREAEEGGGTGEPDPKRPRRAFAPDPAKSALQNLNEFFQKLAGQSKRVTHAQEGAQFRCTMAVVLADGQAHEFVSAQTHGKKKAAEHDVAEVALAKLLAMVSE